MAIIVLRTRVKPVRARTVMYSHNFQGNCAIKSTLLVSAIQLATNIPSYL